MSGYVEAKKLQRSKNAGECSKCEFLICDWYRPMLAEVDPKRHKPGYSVSYRLLAAGGRQLVVLLPRLGKFLDSLGSKDWKVRDRTGKSGHEYALTRFDIND